MNFLAHYYFDGIEGDAYFNFGLILPDLMGIAKRGWKIKGNVERKFQQEPAFDIFLGVLRHLDLDHFFHNSEFFTKQTQAVKDHLAAKRLDKGEFRMFFVVHVLLEIMLDRLIIKKEPEILERFYQDLNLIRKDPVQDFFYQTNTTYWERLFKVFDKFKSAQYLYDYPYNQKFIRALNRTFERVNHPPLGEENDEYIQNVIFDIEEYLNKHFDMLGQELQNYRQS